MNSTHPTRLDYAILSGGDIAPLEGGAVTQLHSTFDWAERSRKVGGLEATRCVPAALFCALCSASTSWPP